MLSFNSNSSVKDVVICGYVFSWSTLKMGDKQFCTECTHLKYKVKACYVWAVRQEKIELVGWVSYYRSRQCISTLLDQ